MILQSRIPYDISPRALPGIQPLPLAEWLIVDDAYAAQMAERERLLRDAREAVLAMTEGAVPAAQELLNVVQETLPAGFDRHGTRIRRPDGAVIDVDETDPLGTLGRLVQEDFCLLEKHGDAHVLTAAVLCFPANWMLSEKLKRPLIGIHTPVAEYDEMLAKRVQRLFDGVQVGRPLWRFNALYYDDPNLHQPRAEHDERAPIDPATAPFLRSERQTMLRLPETRAVVFGIHTFVTLRR
ncbi:heme-dependent oxidative N-demethylase family protein [Tropicibacter naphthalenivorans]|uniref:DUF3445 domain-containing protein n=1 Tax=Tropicibacter naphthalenivorans TaxID=441103 RepID=A0A0P1GVZ3_9RHOB|nr:DUF3445 domain-containing protein [Tropicibacter naphthalenivorans]CUH80054.1 hypothetical protein TRN7648_02773 [Tropicibacter naphthalenivorans]SMC84126.1 Protein of unknown function [Tropicibacter naphthalenivorans]